MTAESHICLAAFFFSLMIVFLGSLSNTVVAPLCVCEPTVHASMQNSADQLARLRAQLRDAEAAADHDQSQVNLAVDLRSKIQRVELEQLEKLKNNSSPLSPEECILSAYFADGAPQL